MAPRTAKAKKAADVKVAENEAPKKSRGKAKAVEEPEQEVPDIDIDDKVAPIIEKKTKRGKKAQDTNGQEQANGIAEEIAPPTKRGRKKNVEEPAPEEKASNGENSAEEDEVHNGDIGGADENSEEAQTAPSGRGRKKPTKKDDKAGGDAKPKETTRGRKVKQDTPDVEEKEVGEEKPKGKGRGRKAQPKAEVEPESDEKTELAEEEVKEPPVTKGRKKTSAKAAKEKTPESDKDELPEEETEDMPLEEKEIKKKGRKGQGKKAQAKEEVEEKDDEVKEEPASKKRKVNKREEKGKGDFKDEDADEEVLEAKPAKGKRGQKKPVEAPVEAQDEPEDTGESTTKRRRKPADDKGPAEDATKKAPGKNKSTTNYEDIDFSNHSKDSQGKEWNFKIASWNVDGIRAWMGKGGLDYLKYEKPDILCLQEVKCAKDKLPDEVTNLPGYHAYWLCSDKDGYAGVGIYTAKLAMNVQYGLQNEELDSEGRIITAEYEQFYLICTYVPNAGRKLVTLPKRLQWNEEFRNYVKELDKKKPVIICGDMNVAHNEIDLANPKTNKKNAGFTEEERSGMSDLLGDGFVDTFRHLNPDKTGAYTFWTYMSNSRAKNVGWRLDYFIVSERMLPSVCDNIIRDGVYGSDHCPLALFLHLSTADKPKE